METAEHVANKIDADIEAIRSNIIRMGGLAEEQLRSALHSFIECDVESVEAIVAGDRNIDQLELDIDRQCANLLSSRQLNPIDLRAVLVISKMVTDLERIGDETKKIARSTNRDGDWQVRQLLVREFGIEHMGQLAAELLHDSLDAYVRLDHTLAEKALRLDKGIDVIYRSTCKKLNIHMVVELQTIPAAMELFSTVKSLERIGDHAKKIAKYVVFVVTGKDIRHLSSQLAWTGY